MHRHRGLRLLLALASGVLACGGADDELSTCRTFAARTSYTTTTTMPGLTSSAGTTTCSFDRARIALTCTATATGATAPISTTTTIWASLEDAVAHNRPLGRITFASQMAVFDLCTFSTQFTYDAEKRLVSVVGSGSPPGNCLPTITTYTSWDPAGRPLAGTTGSPGREDRCSGQTTTRSYDEANRAITTTVSGGTGPNCVEVVSRQVQDAQGLPVLSESTARGGTTTTTITTTETATICR